MSSGRLARFLLLPDRLLVVFAGLCVFTTFTHFGGQRDLYELAVFAYVAFLYVFFSVWPVDRALLWRYALAVGVGACGVALLQGVAGGFQVHHAYEGSTLDFLARRLQLTFDNPNQLASFMVLPVACGLCALACRPREESRIVWRRGLLLMVLLGLPLLLTASRHLILTAALTLGFVCARVPAPSRRLVTWGSWVALAAVCLLFWLTILYPFFPLRSEAPFFTCSTHGMYTIHQAAYWRIVTLDPRSLLFGVGSSSVRALYPLVVDAQTAHAILAQYRMEHLVGTFLTYMDAHNEYLNLAAHFGLPAMASCFAFLVSLAWRPGHANGTPVARMLPFLIAAIAAACLWDDLLSKRWIWITLGLMSAQAGGRPQTAAAEGGDLMDVAGTRSA